MRHFHEAYTNLFATKLRTLLAMLGILVGTGSVVAMVSCGELATQAALAQFKALGTDMLAVSFYKDEDSGTTGNNSQLTLTDSYELKNTVNSINIIAPFNVFYAAVSYQGQNVDSPIIGATNNLMSAINIQLAQGRFISDFDKFANYAVIGNDLYQDLLAKKVNVLGEQIRVGDQLFTIVGVTKPWPENSFFEQDINLAVIIPLNAMGYLTKQAAVNNFVIRLKPNANITQTENQISDFINARLPNEKIFFRSAKELIKSMEAQHKILTWLLGLIGGISLLVGGIGVMNIMLVSVLERRREIGIRLALGARRADIQAMFLLEAVLLSVTGGLGGIAIGILTSFIIAEFANWHFIVFLWPPIVGFSVSVLIGIFFGFYPARQAASLDPIATLRME